ncbi:metallophosphoesterase [Aureisphaera galaxeae]|uniref:metallophosphoesterase n=1 Tax=Aureisphaera galaxeae TaxID=1538023 RepID=UPI002350A167|nr:metallophosphoesterase [Aureisphaera galaxeae]MDC8005282.1 metallophosphoesterase [Aureisphaera galaxeae]
MRTLVVGDIHGGLRALRQVLEKVHPTDGDRFIFLGDYVDGWSEVAETVSFLIEFSNKYACTFIRGNHDYLLYQYLKHNDYNAMWLHHGGASSIESYKRLSKSQKEDHLYFYETLRDYYVDDSNRLFVHAGFTNVHGIHHEHFKNMVFWDRTLWEVARSMDPSLTKDDIHYPQRLALYEEIYIGHTAVSKIGYTVPLNFANLWNIDTGAAFNGPLTVFDVDTKEYWQSDPVYTLYPDEKGRN